MKEFMKKQTVASYAFCASLVLGLIAFIIYLVNATTGYLAGTDVDGGLIAVTLIALILIVLEFVFHDKIDLFNGIFNDLIVVVVGVLFGVGACMYIMDVLALAADVYFIPVNFPKAEGAAVSLAIAGVSFYAFAMIAAAVAAFYPNKFFKALEAKAE